MPSKPDDINREDRELFRNSVGPVKPLRKADRVAPERPRPRAQPLKSREAEAEVLQEMATGYMDPAEVETGEELSYRRAGIQIQLFKRLRRGQYMVEAELDLHGLTSAMAQQELAEFLQTCRQQNRRCVRIIHGKGRGSPEGKPVLKNHLNRWLRLRDEVLAFCSARPVDGGTGAVYVLLRQQKSP